MQRVLRPGGHLLLLELSEAVAPLQNAYEWYSFKVLPLMGKLVTGDAESHSSYLAESFRMHPGRAELRAMLNTAGFDHVNVPNLSAGVVALQVGIKC